jgi:hypothetical protein
MSELKLETIAKMVTALAEETDSCPSDILEYLEGQCWSEEEASRISCLMDVDYAAQERERRYRMYLELKEEFGNE